jgi:hypothetical protein
LVSTCTRNGSPTTSATDHVHVGQPDKQRAHARSVGLPRGSGGWTGAGTSNSGAPAPHNRTPKSASYPTRRSEAPDYQQNPRQAPRSGRRRTSQASAAHRTVRSSISEAPIALRTGGGRELVRRGSSGPKFLPPRADKQPRLAYDLLVGRRRLIVEVVLCGDRFANY